MSARLMLLDRYGARRLAYEETIAMTARDELQKSTARMRISQKHTDPAAMRPSRDSERATLIRLASNLNKAGILKLFEQTTKVMLAYLALNLESIRNRGADLSDRGRLLETPPQTTAATALRP